MPIIIFFVSSGLSMLIFLLSEILRYKRREEEINKVYLEQFIPYKSDFSVSGYYDRIEKTSIEIMQEHEKIPVYTITLWAGLDGLRLNEDGTTEWIRREEEKSKPFSSVAQSAIPPYAGCQNVANQIDDQMRALQSQLNACCTQQYQTILYSQIINALSHAPYPQHPYWTPYLSPCFSQQYWDGGQF